jgi:isopenicillin N synthase-like dioxygenase
MASAWPHLLAYFAQPIEEKIRACSVNRALRGFSPILTENFASLAGERGANDLVEKYRVGPVFMGDKHPCSKGPKDPFYYVNTWPPTVTDDDTIMPTFQQSIEALYLALTRLAETISHAMALALSLPPTYFLERMARGPTSILSVNHYPPLSELTESNYSASLGSCQPAQSCDRMRVAPHSDVSLFTIVGEYNCAADDHNLGGCSDEKSEREVGKAVD